MFRWTWDEVDRRLVSAEEPRGDLPIADPTDPEQRWAQVNIAVNDCGGCVITAYALPENGEERTWASPPVEGGRTRLILPKDDTQSMAFDVTRTDDPVGHFNAVAVVSLASRGEGDAREGSGCWLGATAAVTTLTIRHRTVEVPEVEQPIAGSDTAHIFEADPPLPVTRDQWQFTTDGGLGHQDAPTCASSLM